MLLFFLPFSLLICKLTKRKGQRERKRWREREIELGRQEDGGRDELEQESRFSQALVPFFSFSFLPDLLLPTAEWVEEEEEAVTTTLVRHKLTHRKRERDEGEVFHLK